MCHFAAELGQGEAERSAALRTADDRAARVQAADLPIELALHDKDLDRAWEAADRYGPGVRWQMLAEASAQSMPERTIELCRGALPAQLLHADRRDYHVVAETLTAMRVLAERIGAVDVVDAEVRSIREQYRRRPRLMDILNQHGLPR